MPPGRRPGVLPGAGGRAVASQGLGAVLVPRGGGAVRVQDQGPAPLVDHDVVMEPAQKDAVPDAGLPAAGLVPDVVDLTRRRGLPAAARILITHWAGNHTRGTATGSTAAEPARFAYTAEIRAPEV